MIPIISIFAGIQIGTKNIKTHSQMKTGWNWNLSWNQTFELTWNRNQNRNRKWVSLNYTLYFSYTITYQKKAFGMTTNEKQFMTCFTKTCDVSNHLYASTVWHAVQIVVSNKMSIHLHFKCYRKGTIYRLQI